MQQTARSQALLSSAHGPDKRQRAKIKTQDIPLQHEKMCFFLIYFFIVRDVTHRQSWWSLCLLSSPGDSPGQPDLADPAWAGGSHSTVSRSPFKLQSSYEFFAMSHQLVLASPWSFIHHLNAVKGNTSTCVHAAISFAMLISQVGHLGN